MLTTKQSYNIEAVCELLDYAQQCDIDTLTDLRQWLEMIIAGQSAKIHHTGENIVRAAIKIVNQMISGRLASMIQRYLSSTSSNPSEMITLKEIERRMLNELERIDADDIYMF
jgi:hypothetical protein